MPDDIRATARTCLLDKGYRREVRAVLYEVYRQEPTVAYLFEAQRPGYERRLRAMIRAWVRQHFYLQLPAVGLMVEDRLAGVALIGMTNLLVSFSLALWVALRSRKLRGSDALPLLPAVFKRFLRGPKAFFIPPRERAEEPAEEATPPA